MDDVPLLAALLVVGLLGLGFVALIGADIVRVSCAAGADLRRAGSPLRLIALRVGLCWASIGVPCLALPLLPGLSSGPPRAWIGAALTLGAGVGLAGLAERRAALGGGSPAGAILASMAAGTVAALVAGLQAAYASTLSESGPAGLADVAGALLDPTVGLPVLLGGGALGFLAWGVPCAYVTLGALSPGPMRQADARLLPLLLTCAPVPGLLLLEGCYALALRLEGLAREDDRVVDELLHITTRDAWARALREGRYAPASLTSEGFVHLSSPAQLAGTAARYYAGQTDLVVLVLDAARLAPDVLRWEVSTGGERFPHLYRAIDPAEVLEVRLL